LEEIMANRIWVYRDKRDGQWWADLSHTEYRYAEHAPHGTPAHGLEFGAQKRLPFGDGADWQCVREYVASQYGAADVCVDYLSRS
jgi:hypothetical protein